MTPSHLLLDVPAAEAGGILTIDLAAIVANWRDLAARAAPAACAAVVKADAYGCGIEPVVRALAAAGCRTFFVALLSEARRARAVAPDAAVYVLNGLPPATAPSFAAHDLRPVLGSRDELAEWAAFRAASGWRGGAALHVDTGMNRLGLALDHAAALAPNGSAHHGLAQHGIDLLMSHLACSEDPGNPLNARQIGRFRHLRGLFPGMPASLANSSGIFLGPDAHHDMVRPGVALYGGNPTPAHINPMRPVVRLDLRIVQLREVAAGDTVGYGATWTARRASRIAIVSAGYGDGLLRAAGSSDQHAGFNAVVAGRHCPVAGRISMDLMAIDVTDLPPETPLRRGDMVALLDADIGIDVFAAHAGTIAYEVLTGLGRRYHRTYMGADTPSA